MTDNDPRREVVAAAIYRLNGQALYGRDLGEFDGDRMEAERWRWLEQADLVLAALAATPTAGSKVDTAPEAPPEYVECCASGSCEVCQPHRHTDWGK